MKISQVTTAVLMVFLVACTRAPLKDKKDAMRPSAAPKLSDDLGRADFMAALDAHTAFLATLKPDTNLRFGKTVIALGEYTRALQMLAALSRKTADDATFFALVESAFEFQQVYGANRWGEVLLTSYFEPQIEGARTKTEAFQAPLLKRPDDLIEVAASKYDERLADAGSVRGRLWKDPDRKRDLLIPYYTRAEIEGGALRSRALELCWVHPVDAFFMQVQGSGTVMLPGGENLRLGYSDQNGQMYHSIGKFLTSIIPLEKMSLFTIESYLKSVSPDQAKEVMNRNPSFVFFEKIEGAPKTSLGIPVLPGRTIATDTRYFPKGALAFMRFKKPVFSAPTDAEPTQWEQVSRFVFDQDTGGAIRGGGRVDLFWGSGEQAKRYAGFMKDTADVYYLVPKPETLAKPAEDQLVAPH
jgi:membrane-bound lytic murein transglycosylase A